jgi:hypothetical protein
MVARLAKCIYCEANNSKKNQKTIYKKLKSQQNVRKENIKHVSNFILRCHKPRQNKNMCPFKNVVSEMKNN